MEMYLWYRESSGLRTDRKVRALVLEKYTDGLAVVDSANGLGEDGGDVEHLQLGARAAVFLLGNRVCYNHLVNGRGIDSRDGISTEDAVGDEGIDLGGALALEQLRGARNGVACVDNIVDQNANAVCDITDEHHAGIALLVKFYRPTFLSVGRESESRRDMERKWKGRGCSLPCE